MEIWMEISVVWTFNTLEICINIGQGGKIELQIPSSILLPAGVLSAIWQIIFQFTGVSVIVQD